MDLVEMQRFKVRAMEIGRKSRNPAKCLRLMQVKATSILGFDVFAGGRECCPPEFFLTPKGAMVSSAEGIQAGKKWVTNGAAEAAAVAFQPAGARFTAHGVVDPGTRHGKAPQIEPVADGTDNAIDVGSDVQGTFHFSATDDLGTQQNEAKSFSVLLCGIDEKLSFFHGSVDGVTGTNSVSISLNYTQSEETAEMDQNFAGKFRNMNRSRFYFDNTVLVEEPDPGDMGTPRIGLAQWMKRAPGDDLIAADGETKNVRVKEGVEEVKVGENSVDKAGLLGQPYVPQ